MRNFNTFDWLAIALLIIGGINWGMISLFNIDLVSSLFGVMSVLTRVIYALVGVSALYMVFAALFESSASTTTSRVVTS